MTANFPESHAHDSQQPSPENRELDRFELLSAYLDGEVTPQERQLVEEWLESDRQIQGLHQRLLAVRQGLQQLPILPDVTPDHLIQKLFQKLDRCQYQRWALWGGGAIAAGLMAVLGNLWMAPQEAWSPRLAENNLPQEKVPPTATIAQEQPAGEPLMIALNRPIIQIPKTASVQPLVVTTQTPE